VGIFEIILREREREREREEEEKREKGEKNFVKCDFRELVFNAYISMKIRISDILISSTDSLIWLVVGIL